MNSIIFRPELIRAILAGKKNQTRRPIKRIATIGAVHDFGKKLPKADHYPTLADWACRDRTEFVRLLTHEQLLERCPYGKIGDRIRVLETWCPARGLAFEASSELLKSPAGAALRPGIIYRADGEELPPGCRWRPSIHMPRHFSRISLVITRVRVERLRDISESDAIAEGFEPWPDITAVGHFRHKWGQIYADKPELSWQANPHIWCLTFKAERTQ